VDKGRSRFDAIILSRSGLIMQSERIGMLESRLGPLRKALLSHAVYGRIRGISSLRAFMEYHVFAVWDFMSLLKALQRRLTCVEVPWVPVADAAACRLVNEIVLGEESDEDGQGGYSSHFDLYLSAMRQYGADVGPVNRLVASIRGGMSLQSALDEATLPSVVRAFVENSFAVIERGDCCAIASAFTFGREDLLPDMFRRIVDELEPGPKEEADLFRYYLDRHIAVDSGEHGPSAELLVERLCGDDDERWAAAERAAVRSLEARLKLWDGVCERIDAGGGGREPGMLEMSRMG
jgi:hypothetical protein